MVCGNEECYVSAISIGLYGSLVIVCSFLYLNSMKNTDTYEEANQIYRTRKYFFLVLGSSALLDLPFYIDCLAAGSPTNCIWDSNSPSRPAYIIGWIFHLVALIGYFISVGVPLFLWSNSIQGRMRSPFSLGDYDWLKRFLHATFFIYSCLMLIEIVDALLNINDPISAEDSLLTRVSRTMESVFYSLVAAVWLAHCLRLQWAVFKFQRSQNSFSKDSS